MRKKSPRRKKKPTAKTDSGFPEVIPQPPQEKPSPTDMDIDKECDRLVAEHLLHNRLVPKNQYDRTISLFEQTVATQKPACKEVFSKKREKKMRNPLFRIQQIDLDDDENQHQYGFFLR